LAECCVYLALSPKSNYAYLGIDAALGWYEKLAISLFRCIYAMHPRN
jgi:replication-associated recombination protein RarA